MLDKAIEFLEKKAVKSLDTKGGLINKIKELLSKSSNHEKSKEMMDKTLDVVKNSKTERASLFKEVGKSLLVRQMPNLAAANDLTNALSGNKTKEVHFGQHAIETVTASLALMSHFVPDKYMRYLTDIFANNETFRLLVKYWPGLDGLNIPLVGNIPIIGNAIGKGGHIRERILKDKDPTAVIMALRVIHQDIVMGKVTFDALKDLTGNSNLLAGGGIATGIIGLILGSQALKDKTNSSPERTKTTKMLNNIKDTINKPSSKGGKKIMDLVKQNINLEQTDMQKHLVNLIRALHIEKSAKLVNGTWGGNNDDCTISFTYEKGLYYIYFDEDVISTDIKVKNSKGIEIANITDWGNFNAQSNANDIKESIEKHPSPKIKKTKKPEKTPTTHKNK